VQKVVFNKARAILTAALILYVSAGMLGSSAVAGELQRGAPEDHGMSAARLDGLSRVLQAEIKETQTPGAALLIMRHGKIVYEDVFGYQDRVAGIKMQRDSIFRIHSMTKPIVSAAALTLLEEGKILLTDPVGRFIPAFEDVQVAVMNAEQTEIVSLEKPRRAMTIQDLLRHTSGLTGTTYGKDTVLRQMYRDVWLQGGGLNNEKYANRIAELPLNSHPGSQWEYGISTTILGRVIEVVSGTSLGEFLEDRIFDPLAMDDTGFTVREDQLIRVAHGYDPGTGGYANYLPHPGKTPSLENGSGGLWSSLSDFAKFSQMILDGGELDGVRVLGTKTVELMTANHLGPEIAPGPLYLPGPGHGFGLGFAVRLTTGISGRLGSKGELRWGGWAGTQFWIDPVEDLICIWMIQDVANSGRYRWLFKNLVYQAIID
jgi:CubicO group peptidase (beta-lactamase class C family)